MTVHQGQHIFETGLGFMAIAWNAAGISRVLMPERDRASVERRLLRLYGSAAPDDGHIPPHIQNAIELLKAYAEGKPGDFSDVPIDLDGVDAFRLSIYDAARKLSFGETVTYGELAALAGHSGLARETGQALGQNPVPIIVPCHRIVAANGKIGGFSAPGGSRTKEKLLALEGVVVGPPPPSQAAFTF